MLGPFLSELVFPLIQVMGDAYPGIYPIRVTSRTSGKRTIDKRVHTSRRSFFLQDYGERNENSTNCN